MTCQEVMEDMQRYVDGDLDESESDLLMAHLNTCPECSEMLERLERLSAELEHLPKVTPPFSLVDAILPKLDELDAAASQSSRLTMELVSSDEVPSPDSTTMNAPISLVDGKRRRRRFVFGAWGGAVAAAAAAIFLILYQPNLMSTSEQTADGTAPITSKASKEIVDDNQSNIASLDSEGDLTDSAAGAFKKDTSTDAPLERKGTAPMGKQPASSSTSSDAAENTAIVSPDGKYTVAYIDHIISVYEMGAEQRLLFSSQPKEGIIGKPVWSPDSSSFSYTVEDASGNSATYKFDIDSGMETKQ